MGFEVKVTGVGNVRATQRRLDAVGSKGLGKQMAAGFRRATAPFKPALQAEAVAAMPSGYGPTLSRSMRLRQAIRGSGTTAEAHLRVFAQGRSKRRALPDLNRGLLRHKLYGNPKFWYSQRVRPGVVDRPADRLIPQAVREMRAVRDYVADQIGG
jgi:hypothetical protein